MLTTRYLRARSAPLRLLHSTAVRSQQLPQNEPLEPFEDILDPLYREIEDTPSTHRAAVTSSNTPEPREIFNAWGVDQFYAPLAFLRSRRMKAAPTRASYPTVGPGATQAAHSDVFRQLAIDPVNETNNTTLISAFVTSMGRIRARSYSGLSWRSQRKVTQAIKLAKHKGVIPILHRAKYYVPKRSSNDK